MALQQTFCRLCYVKEVADFSLVEDQIVQMLESLTLKKITPFDKVSGAICAKCVTDLKNAYIIQQKIIRAERKCKDDDETLLQTQYKYNNRNLGVTKSSLGQSTNQSQQNLIYGICSQESLFSNDIILGHKNKEHTKQEKNTTEEYFDECKYEVLCEHCGEVCLNQGDFEIHLKNIHKCKHVCDVCGEDFLEKSELHQHKMKHSKFVCDVCQETFSLRYVLQMHKLQHLSENSHHCQYCGRKFKYDLTLMVHKRLKHEKSVIEK